MTLFRLVSTAEPQALVVEFYGASSAAALDIAKRACLAEADLWQERDYIFTLRKHGDNGDFWIVYRKPELSTNTAAAA